MSSRNSAENLLRKKLTLSIEETMDACTVLWRLMYAHEQIINTLPDHRRKAALNTAKEVFDLTFEHLQNLLYPQGIRIRAYEGRTYSAGFPLDALNLGEFERGEKLVVQETVEPAFLHNMRALRRAKVILGRVRDTDRT